WSFGDGSIGSGPVVQHTYAGAGSYQVSLTVRDGGGLQDTATRTAEPATAGVELVGAAGSEANTTQHSVAVPADVRAGDVMVLFLTNNTTGVTIGNPAGWSPAESVDGTGFRARAWTRTATAADVGGTV